MQKIIFNSIADYLQNKDAIFNKCLQDISDLLTTTESESLKALADKISWIAGNNYRNNGQGIGSPCSIVPMLERITTKGIKKQSKKDGTESESLGLGHFRWNYGAITLKPNEVEIVRTVLDYIKGI